MHPTLGHWFRAGYPVVICTDDTTLFGITLSDELARVAIAYGRLVSSYSSLFDTRGCILTAHAPFFVWNAKG